MLRAVRRREYPVNTPSYRFLSVYSFQIMAINLPASGAVPIMALEINNIPSNLLSTYIKWGKKQKKKIRCAAVISVISFRGVGSSGNTLVSSIYVTILEHYAKIRIRKLRKWSGWYIEIPRITLHFAVDPQGHMLPVWCSFPLHALDLLTWLVKEKLKRSKLIKIL